jgi:dethiobiotin synthetase
MTDCFVVAGTDTGVGKTVFATALTAALDGYYWKPIQAGGEPETDSETVARIGGVGPDRVLASAYTLAMPASPHIAARRAGIVIRQRHLALPEGRRPLIVETAGGVLVPLSERLLQVDLLATWQRPVILCARTGLGTINHCLLTIEALRRRRVPVHGVAFVGEPEPEVEATIAAIGRVRRLGRLRWLERVDAAGLAFAFAEGFDIKDFREEAAPGDVNEAV